MLCLILVNRERHTYLFLSVVFYFKDSSRLKKSAAVATELNCTSKPINKNGLRIGHSCTGVVYFFRAQSQL